MFADPAGQYAFQVPYGWAYDVQASHLITIRFESWRHPGESVSVRAMPSFAPPDAPLDDWHAALLQRCFPPRMRPVARLKLGGKPAASAEAHHEAARDDEEQGDGGGVHRRLLVVRGPRIDVLIEHRAPEPSTGARMSDVLSAIGQSLEVPPNRALPAFVEQDGVIELLRRAHGAVRERAWSEVIEPARAALEAARSTYLYSLVADAPLPEVPAIGTVADALIMLGQASGELAFVRQAEHLSLRAIYTLDHLPLLAPGRRRSVRGEFEQRLEAIVDLQLALMGGNPKAPPRPGPGLGLATLRGDALLKGARAHEADGLHGPALALCDAAADDIQIVLAALPRLRQPLGATAALPETMRQAVADLPEEERTAWFVRLSRRSTLGELLDVLSLTAHLNALEGDAARSIEASGFAAEVAAQLAGEEELAPGRVALPAGNAREWRAHALIEHATNLAMIEDAASLEEAHGALDRAEALLDEIGEEAGLRAWLCLARASLLHSERRLEGAIEVIDRGLRAAARAPAGAGEHFTGELKTIKSQFLIHLGELERARDLAAEVTRMPEGATPRERLKRAGTSSIWVSANTVSATATRRSRACTRPCGARSRRPRSARSRCAPS